MTKSRYIHSLLLHLPCSRPAVMIGRRAWVPLVLCSCAQWAIAQDDPEPTREELDVTMEIIADPGAKLPDEVVRRIPLPARKPAQESSPKKGDQETTPEAGKKQQPAQEAQGQEARGQEGQGLGREMSERAKERAKEAAEQREQARRSEADERRRNPGPPSDPPGRPPRPGPPRS